MFDSVRNNKKIVQIFLALITLPFAFFGIDSYVRNTGAGSDIASVGKTKITAPQFEQALRERQDKLRNVLGDNYSPEMINSPEARLSVLNSVIDQQLLLLEADKNKLHVSNEMLIDFISKIPVLQENGKFSPTRYESVLRAQGMSQPQFESKLRQDLTFQQLLGAVGDVAFVSNTQAEAMLRVQSEEREFSEFRVATGSFAAKVNVDAAAVQKYYDDNTSQFETPEQVKAEFVVLSPEVLLEQVTVSDGDVKAWYEGHLDRYAAEEERRASHILMGGKDAAGKEKAKAKMEELLAEVQKTPAKFAELAAKYSEDTGSAKTGGDLGFFARGIMAKTFEEAAFKLKEGELSGLVESEFGYHIIKLTAIKPSRQRTLDEAQAEIQGDLKQQAASRKFTEAAETFNNMVYEQSDSLQPVAEKFNLKIQPSALIAKKPDAQAMAALGPLANPKILAQLFSEDSIKNKRNTEAVEVSSGTLVAARVLEHIPASIKPFETVKAEIENRLKNQEVLVMAKQFGETTLAELSKGGEDKLAWSPAKSTTRMKNKQVSPTAQQAIFTANVEKLPAYAGVASDNGYTIYKIGKVVPLETVEADKLKSQRLEYDAIVAQEDMTAYLAGLRARYKVTIDMTRLESKERPQ